MFEVCLFGMTHDPKKFLRRCNPTLGLVLLHQTWNRLNITFSEAEIPVENAHTGCLQDPRLLAYAFA
jgi:hypothetical protein